MSKELDHLRMENGDLTERLSKLEGEVLLLRAKEGTYDLPEITKGKTLVHSNLM